MISVVVTIHFETGKTFGRMSVETKRAELAAELYEARNLARYGVGREREEAMGKAELLSEVLTNWPKLAKGP